jgi:hypothetical protein
VHGKVTVNGDPKGVYAITENVDGRFIDHAFPKGQGDGNLYKDAWPSNKSAAFYAERQKTNEKPDPAAGRAVVPPTKVVSFATMLDALAPKDALPLVDRWLGIDHMLRMLAIDVAINNWDGPRTFYCGGPGKACPGGHNFYVYESPTEDRLHYVAWDLDLTFDRVNAIEGTPGTNVPFWNTPIPASECATRRWAATWGGQFLAPGCDRLFQVLAAAGRERWVAALKKALDGPLALEKMRADVDRWAAQIDADVKTDTKGPVLYAEWKTQVQRFKEDLAFLRQKAEALAK